MRISWVTKTFRRVVRFFRGWRCVEKGLRLDKNISKKVYGVKGRLFLQNTKTSHRNIQYSSYLLSKCLGNLFSVSPQRQRPKYKVFFCGYQLWRRQSWRLFLCSYIFDFTSTATWLTAFPTNFILKCIYVLPL